MISFLEDNIDIFVNTGNIVVLDSDIDILVNISNTIVFQDDIDILVNTNNAIVFQDDIDIFVKSGKIFFYPFQDDIDIFVNTSDLNFFPSMISVSENTTDNPLLSEYEGKAGFRVYFDLPDINQKVSIPPEMCGPMKVSYGKNKFTTFSLELRNFHNELTGDNSEYKDLLTEEIWCPERKSRKFLEIHVVSECGEKKKKDIFDRLVIKDIDGEFVLSLSGISERAELLTEPKNWTTYVPEDTAINVTYDYLSDWQANTEYVAGDIIQPSTFTPYSVEGTFEFTYSTSYLSNIYRKVYTKKTFNKESVTCYYKIIEDSYYSRVGITLPVESTYTYEYPICPGFKCIQAGKSGSVEPSKWPVFTLDKSNSAYNEYLNNYLYKWAIPDEKLPELFAGYTDTVTDGTCVWQYYIVSDSMLFVPPNITLRHYNRSLGSEVMVNYEQKYSPDDFIYLQNSNCYAFKKYVYSDEPVFIRNPIPAKWLFRDILQKSSKERYEALGITDTLKYKMDFEDYFIYNDIQVQNTTPISLIESILQAIGGEWIEDYSVYPSVLRGKNRILKSERKSLADFVIPKSLINGNIEKTKETVEYFNIQPVIKRAKVKTAYITENRDYTKTSYTSYSSPYFAYDPVRISYYARGAN